MNCAIKQMIAGVKGVDLYFGKVIPENKKAEWSSN